MCPFRMFTKCSESSVLLQIVVIYNIYQGMQCASVYLVYIIYIIIYLRTVGWIEKSITICSCSRIFGINVGMLLLTNRFNVYFLWEPFPS